MTTQKGGSANIRGVFYQMLWSLLRTSELVLERFDPKAHEDGSDFGYLVVEPNQGGDDRFVRTGGTFVHQLKSRADEGTWSFKSFVEEVLPDLYRAAEAYPEAKYLLVTEGRIGEWKEALDFLGSFVDTRPDAKVANVLDLLDDKETIEFSGSLPTLKTRLDRPTARELFLGIAETINKSGPKGEEDRRPLYRNLWRLLGGLEYRWSERLEGLRTELRTEIAASVNFREDVDQTLYAMVGRLEDKASRGETRIDGWTFWQDCGLRGLPLIRWNLIRDAARSKVSDALRFRRYRPEEDVRANWFEGEIAEWLGGDRTYLALEGGSGQGKTWFLCSLARRLSESRLCIFVAARDKGDDTRAEVERILTQEIVGWDRAIPLSGLARRARDLGVDVGNPWLYVFVDDVRSVEQAVGLYDAFDGQEGVRIAFAAPVELASSEPEERAERTLHVAVPNFTTEQARRYVTGEDFYSWQTLEPLIRSTIHRPLLAYLFKDLGNERTLPKSEYELYDGYFRRRILASFTRSRPFIGESFAKFGVAAWNTRRTVWDRASSTAAGFEDGDVQQLVDAGWLAPSGEGEFRIWHERLASWSMAWGIAEGLLRGTLDSTEIGRDLKSEYRAGEYGGADLTRQYVPMDLFWILVQKGDAGLAPLKAIFTVLEDDWMNVQPLYETWLPSFGESTLPFLLDRLGEAGGVDRWSVVGSIAKGIGKIPSSETRDRLLALLDHEDSDTRTATARVYRARPTSKATSKLWERYLIALRGEVENAGPSERTPESEGPDRKQEWWVEAQTHQNALLRCGPLDSDWVERTILDPSVRSEALALLVHLLTLLPDGKARWLRVKGVVGERLDKHYRAAFSDNVFAWKDSEETGWLQTEMESDDIWRGPRAARAWMRVDLDALFGKLPLLNTEQLRFGRGWTVDPLVVLAKDRLTMEIDARLSGDPENRWTTVEILHDRPDVLSPPAFEALLDDLEVRLRDGRLSGLWPGIQLFGRALSPQQLRAVMGRAGTDLDHLLADVLSRPANELEGTVGFVPRELKKLLFRIAGPGLTRHVNACLSSTERWTLREGIESAHIRPDGDTASLLMAAFRRRRTMATKPHDGTDISLALAQCEAWAEFTQTLIELEGWHDPKLLQLRSEGRVFRDDELRAAFEALEKDPRSPAALMALGYGQRTDQVDRMVGIIMQEGPGSRAANAAIQALYALPRPPKKAISAIASCVIGLESRREVHMLCEEGGEEARSALERFVREELSRSDRSSRSRSAYDPVVWAVEALMKGGEGASGIVELCRSRIGRLAEGDVLAEILVESLGPFALSDEKVGEALNSPVAREHLERLAVRRGRVSFGPDSPASALRSLRLWSREQVQATALTLLEQGDVEVRRSIPRLLAELDPVSSFDILFRRLSAERMPSVRMVIGRVLASGGHEADILRSAESADAETRAWACFVLGFASHEERNVVALRDRLEDVHVNVFNAAVEALNQLHSKTVTECLIDGFVAERDRTRRLVYLDAVIRTADCGDDHSPDPEWLGRFFAGMSSLEKSRAYDLFEKRRKDDRKAMADLDGKVDSLF